MKKKASLPNVGVEIDVTEIAARLQADAQAVLREETDAAEVEGLSENEAIRRVNSALLKHSYRDVEGNVAPIPDGLKNRMASRMDCPPDEVDRMLKMNEAIVRVSDLRSAINDALEQEGNAIEEEIQNGAEISDEDARMRLLSAHERGWTAGLERLRENER